MQPEDGDNDRKVQNSQFCERVSQVGTCMHLKCLHFLRA